MMRAAVMFSAWTVLLPASLYAQAVPADLTSEVKAIRQSLDQLVIVLRELVEQTARRDTISTLTERIATAERRLAPLEQDLRTIRQRQSIEESALVEARKAVGSMQEMAKMDTTGAAASAIETESNRLAAAEAQRSALVARLAQQAEAIENDLARRRETITWLDAELDRLLTVKR